MLVSFMGRNIAKLGLHLFERKGDTDRQRLTDHPLAVGPAEQVYDAVPVLQLTGVRLRDL